MKRDSERTTALRSLLVETVDHTPARRGRLRPRWVLAAIAAFALGGAGTGGAVAAFATSAGPGDDDRTETVRISTASFAEQILGSHAQTFGTPFVISGSGSIVVELGERPEGATSLLLLTGCVDAGHLDVELDGVWNSGQDCDEPHGGGGGFTPVPGDGPHELALDGTGRYLVWAVWAADQPAPEPSAAQQAEMADGVITEAEYQAAFARFSQCMSDAGYPLSGVGPLGPLMNYSTSDAAWIAGADRQCYESEFMQVDSTWQLEHQDESETATILRRCLEENGIPAPEHMEDIHAALEDAGISFEDCVP